MNCSKCHRVTSPTCADLCEPHERAMDCRIRFINEASDFLFKEYAQGRLWYPGVKNCRDELNRRIKLVENLADQIFVVIDEENKDDRT